MYKYISINIHFKIYFVLPISSENLATLAKIYHIHLHVSFGSCWMLLNIVRCVNGMPPVHMCVNLHVDACEGVQVCNVLVDRFKLMSDAQGLPMMMLLKSRQSFIELKGPPLSSMRSLENNVRIAAVTPNPKMHLACIPLFDMRHIHSRYSIYVYDEHNVL